MIRKIKKKIIKGESAKGYGSVPNTTPKYGKTEAKTENTKIGYRRSFVPTTCLKNFGAFLKPFFGNGTEVGRECVIHTPKRRQ